VTVVEVVDAVDEVDVVEAVALCVPEAGWTRLDDVEGCNWSVMVKDVSAVVKFAI